MSVKKGLGKGLGALIAGSEEENTGVKEISLNEIEPNTSQPRRAFDDEKLLGLAESIKVHGVVQPIIVKHEGDLYKIIAGERRWRAARLAGLRTIPAIIKEYSDRQVMEIALIENIQREDLNPIEEADAYERLLTEHELTQEELAHAVGKSRSAIANSIRLIKLDSRVKELLINDDLSNGHARCLLAIDDNEIQFATARHIVDKELNVRDTEKLVKEIVDKKEKIEKKAHVDKLAQQAEQISYIYKDIEDRLIRAFGTKVTLQHTGKKGKILIEYYSNDELDRIIELVNTMKSVSRETI